MEKEIGKETNKKPPPLQAAAAEVFVCRKDWENELCKLKSTKYTKKDTIYTICGEKR